MSEQGRKITSQAEKHFGAKENYDELCQELATFYMPERADFTDEIYSGEEFADHIVDSTPMRARRNLGDAFSAMLRPKSESWFRASVPDDDVMSDVAARRYLDGITETNRNILYAHGNGFERAMKELDHDYVTFGGGATSITLSQNADRFDFRTWHMRDIAYGEDATGNIVRIYRKWHATAQHIVALFKDDSRAKVPDAIQEAFNSQNYTQEFLIYHCVVPIDEYDAERKPPRNARWMSAYVDANGSEIIKEMPEFEFPYLVPRWMRIRTWGPYPFSPPTMYGLPDARMLQRIMVTHVEAGEKMVDPPIVATSDAVSSPIDLTSGAVTWVDSEYDERLGAALRPLDLGKNIPLNDYLINRFHDTIADTFYLSKLALPDTREMTAYEVSQRIQEFIRNVRPLFEPVTDEINGQLLDIVTTKALRLGAYGPDEFVPDSLAGQEIKFEFTSPLSDVMERRKTEQFNASVQVLGIAAQARQAPGSILNVDAAEKAALLGTGAPAEWLKTDDEKAFEDAIAAQQAQQAQQIAAFQQSADAAKTASEAAVNVQEVIAR